MTTVDSIQTQINSVIALYSNGQIQEALDSVETLTKDYPDEPLLYNISGVCYRAISKLDEAVKSFEKALTLKPDFAGAHNNLGIVFMELDQLDEAVKCFEKALAIKPDFAEAHNNFGIIFKEMGQTDEAVKCFEKALFVNPDYAQAYRHLVTIKKYTASDPQISQMQSILSNGDLNKSDRIHLCFALAKVYEDLGKQDELFKFLHEGNRLRKQELNYSLDKDQSLFSIVKKCFAHFYHYPMKLQLYAPFLLSECHVKVHLWSSKSLPVIMRYTAQVN